jgi:hypothetical protein
LPERLKKTGVGCSALTFSCIVLNFKLHNSRKALVNHKKNNIAAALPNTRVISEATGRVDYRLKTFRSSLEGYLVSFTRPVTLAMLRCLTIIGINANITTFPRRFEMWD